MILTPEKCIHCAGTDLTVYGYYKAKRRYKCIPCNRVFVSHYTYKAYDKTVSEQIISMAVNGGGTRETGRVLQISNNTITAHLKKSQHDLKCK